jgi:hypothetical protein
MEVDLKTQNGDASPNSLHSSLTRSSNDVFARIAYYINSKEVAKLFQTGNALLRTKLGLCLSSLVCTSPRSLTFFFGHFRNLRCVEIYIHDADSSANLPLEWPSNLQELSVTNFTCDAWLNGPFPPNLNNLRLTPRQYYFKPTSTQTINRLWSEGWLPPKLTVLSIPSFGREGAKSAHLPRGLYRLEIYFCKKRDEVPYTFQEALDFLAGLPQGLRRLQMQTMLHNVIAFNRTDEELTLLLKVLPSNLEFAQGIDACLKAANHVSHLPSGLVELDLESHVSISAKFIQNLPPTLTRLAFYNCKFLEEDFTSSSPIVLPWSLTKLEMVDIGEKMSDIINQSVLTNLRTLHIRDYGSYGPAQINCLPVVPPNVTDLQLAHDPPQGWNFPKCLKRFTLRDSELYSDFEWLSQLPRSVEEIYIGAYRIQAKALSRLDASFTKLHTLHLTLMEGVVTNEMLRSLPRSIRKLVLNQVSTELDLMDLFSSRHSACQ